MVAKISILDRIFAKKKISKAYMAISYSVPIVGDRFYCWRFEKLEEELGKMINCRTATVKKIESISDTVYILKTENANYFTKILGTDINEEHVHFIVCNTEPEVGKNLKCYELIFFAKSFVKKKVEVSKILKVENANGIFKVNTKNDIYIVIVL